ncbi:MAG: ABC transporter ATP-binding protein [Pseudomonadota bacterium]
MNEFIKPEVIIKIENIVKQFKTNDYKTVDNISLDITRGESFSLLGPSGCGKTTLMRMIAGFEKPDSGRIFIDGVDMTDIPPYQRPVNMMFQSYALFPHMDIWQNVAFGLKQEKLPKSEIEKRVTETLEMVGMIHFAHRKPWQISGGQQQRIALARSIIKRPKVLLLDEPLGALDRQTSERTQVELTNIQRLLDITFLVVTHDQEEAMSMSDRMAVMKDGKLQQIGTPKDIYEYPNSRFVAKFVGSINIFHGYVMDNSKKHKLTISSDEIEAPMLVNSYESLDQGTEVWVAVRPEEMGIYSEEDDDTHNHAEGVIVDIAFLGNQIIYHVELNSKKIVHVSLPTSARAKNPLLDYGNKVYVSWDKTDGVLLKS